METTNVTTAGAVVCLSPLELSLVRNVVTFVLEEFYDDEFHTRLGLDRDDVRAFIRLLDSNGLTVCDGRGFVFSKFDLRAIYSSFNEVLYGLRIDDYAQSLGANRDRLQLLDEKIGRFYSCMDNVE